jgi:hypothetical protein
LSLLAWYVFAPQCMATLATVKRETGGWKWALVMAAYLFALAYVASFVTYRVAPPPMVMETPACRRLSATSAAAACEELAIGFF